MRITFFILFIIIFCSPCLAGTVIKESFYKPDLEQCDKIARQNLESGNLTTSGMNLSMDQQIQCYETVAYKIIDKYYSKKAENMKSDVKNAIKSVYEINLDKYWDDSCAPTCGSTTTSRAYNDALNFIKSYIGQLVKHLNN